MNIIYEDDYAYLWDKIGHILTFLNSFFVAAIILFLYLNAYFLYFFFVFIIVIFLLRNDYIDRDDIDNLVYEAFIAMISMLFVVLHSGNEYPVEIEIS